ncbi:transposase [Virgisporangium aliadipatigenens]|uniref:Transposase n=1 Tax=Virgisporangium aliadipatigenens TaxID=741659 RepID=A0A8J4DW42_9ACTN|nr:transposase [Virgisporangium aliadipatigenens]
MMSAVIRRYELSDSEWESLSQFLPSTLTGGRPRSDDRRVLNGVVWKVRSGAPWRDVPARYGSWKSVYTRFRRWALDGTFARMLAGVQASADAVGDINWLVSVDSTIVRAHQHAAAGKGGSGKRTNRRITPSDDLEVD